MVAKMNFLKLFSKSTIFQKLKDLFLSDRKGNYKEVIDDLIDQQDISDKKIDEKTKKFLVMSLISMISV